MSLKIDATTAATAFHIVTGATVFPYAVDAYGAASHHPDEWSMTPWTPERASAARARAKARYDRDVANAKAAGLPPPDAPLYLNPPPPLDPEDQAAIDEHTKAQVEAAARLAKFDKDEADRKAVLDAVEADRALVASPPPQPDPSVRRPFGRKGEPTQAEKDMMAKRAAAGPQPQGPVATKPFVAAPLTHP